jgi:hypothetical protein
VTDAPRIAETFGKLEIEPARWEAQISAASIRVQTYA